MNIRISGEKLITLLSVPLVALMVAAALLAPVSELMEMRILIIAAGINAVIFQVIYVLQTRRRRAKSIERLQEAVRMVGEGNFDLELPLEKRNELNPLIIAFNQMVRQVRERTMELQLERYGRIRAVIDGEEMERQRLSRELHDGIGQLLIAIKLRLESLLYQDSGEIKVSIQELRKYLDQIIDEVRRISNNLMPSVLEAFGPVVAFRNLFSETEEHSGLRIQFEARGDFESMDKKVKTYIYRLTQEAMSNIVKHAGADRVRVNLSRKDEMVVLEIQDNGKGFHPEAARMAGGNGIYNMQERASLLGGHISIRSVPGQGTGITLEVPIFRQHVNDQDFPRG